MTVPTPEQMRALAEDNDAANTVTVGITLVQRRNLAGESAHALRAAADQLEAVQHGKAVAWNEGFIEGCVASWQSEKDNPYETADTAPQEGRDD